MTRRRCTWSISAVGAAVLLTVAPARALQPLDAFVASAKQKNPDNREAAAVERQRAAQRDVATGAFLPSFSAQAIYTRNQYDASFAGPTGTITIQPLNGIDGIFTLTVPVVNVGAWMQRRAAEGTRLAAAAARQTTEVSVETNVTQAYYQVLGSEALVAAAKRNLEVANGNRDRVADRKELGTAGGLDLQRAIADVAKAQQDLATAEQGLLLARRSLESLTRLSPEPATRGNLVEDDLHDEGALERWLKSSNGDLVAVRAAALTTDAARRSREAALAAWAPTVTGQAQERVSNVGGFAARNTYYTLTVNATWRLDFTLAPAVSVQTAGVAIAEAREDKARRAADDAIYQAWQQVRLGIEKARAARAQVKAATLARDLARDRYAAGVATQLEVVQAQRDLFSAAVSQVQADADLQYARALLRLSVRRAPTSTNPEESK